MGGATVGRRVWVGHLCVVGGGSQEGLGDLGIEKKGI